MPYKAEHAIEIIERQPRQPCLQINQNAKEWAKYLEVVGPAVTGLWNGNLAGAGGLMFNGPYSGVAEAWCLFGHDVDEELVSVRALWAKESKRQLEAWIEEHKLVRIEANVRADFEHGKRFVEFMGLEYESTRPKYYSKELAGLMYVKIIER